MAAPGPPPLGPPRVPSRGSRLVERRAHRAGMQFNRHFSSQNMSQSPPRPGFVPKIINVYRIAPQTIAVRKERSVCTVTAVATDDAAIACALGSSGKVELWDRRRSSRVRDLDIASRRIEWVLLRKTVSNYLSGLSSSLLMSALIAEVHNRTGKAHNFVLRYH